MSSILKILIVDDNPAILRLIGQTLEKCGELLTAADGWTRQTGTLVESPLMDTRGVVDNAVQRSP